jgi:hypothetical protein
MKKLTAIIFWCLFLSCSKTSTNNDITQRYLNFLANDVYNSFTGTFGFDNTKGISYGYTIFSTDSIGFSILAGANTSLSLTLFTAHPIVNKKINISIVNSGYASDTGTNRGYTFDSTRSYVIFTRLDSSAITGTFECHGTNNIGQTVDITNGKFGIPR